MSQRVPRRTKAREVSPRAMDNALASSMAKGARRLAARSRRSSRSCRGRSTNQ